ncbi:SET domain-containing protein [Pseudovirgaria hyperparasitica]|uniref:SET domain-containing protein n=1 Tax=Pseudovirgaria hyperparasitica TaxID=470096 RepID=A0A6A6WFN2_9PEZI|nr:SET domain-containing protein [Pseudovirgaria hyperparasitica]KAF2761632.1 SET domain-containing protein [Pseudovirgaria hyperparasitica]
MRKYNEPLPTRQSRSGTRDSTRSKQPPRKFRISKIHSIVSYRSNPFTEESEYLLRWITPKNAWAQEHPPLSWHTLEQLSSCLSILQDYLQRQVDIQSASSRKISPTAELHHSVAIYNGEFVEISEQVHCISSQSPDVSTLELRNIPPPQELTILHRRQAELAIRAEFQRRLKQIRGPPITISNTVDATTPSLKFEFIEEYKIRPGVHRADEATITGCQSCSPKMGRGIGCEYTKKCECLEYALVNEKNLDDKQRELYAKIQETREGSTMGMPKKFPYYVTGSYRNGCLVSFYLDSRHPIYECNQNCACGPGCKNRKVQHGRKVRLEIFKTETRGWGLRALEKLVRGTFIDTYRGEVITDKVASAREAKGDRSKASYLYELDKFKESQGIPQEDIYVVDGQFFSGPTRFMNHSCEPNCKQYTVSYNKHDYRIYDIALFAYRDIEPLEELTFDYQDKDEEEEEDDEMDIEFSQAESEEKVPCNCGAKKCRKWLWI